MPQSTFVPPGLLGRRPTPASAELHPRFNSQRTTVLSSTNYPTLLRTLRVGRSVPVMIRPASEVYTRKNEPKGHIRSAVNSDCLCRTCQERTPRLARRSPSTSPTLFAQIAKSNPPQDALQAWPETGVQPHTHADVWGHSWRRTNQPRPDGDQGKHAGGASRGRKQGTRSSGTGRRLFTNKRYCSLANHLHPYPPYPLFPL